MLTTETLHIEIASDTILSQQQGASSTPPEINGRFFGMIGLRRHQAACASLPNVQLGKLSSCWSLVRPVSAGEIFVSDDSSYAKSVENIQKVGCIISLSGQGESFSSDSGMLSPASSTSASEFETPVSPIAAPMATAVDHDFSFDQNDEYNRVLHSENQGGEDTVANEESVEENPLNSTIRILKHPTAELDEQLGGGGLLDAELLVDIASEQKSVCDNLVLARKSPEIESPEYEESDKPTICTKNIWESLIPDSLRQQGESVSCDPVFQADTKSETQLLNFEVISPCSAASGVLFDHIESIQEDSQSPSGEVVDCPLPGHVDEGLELPSSVEPERLDDFEEKMQKPMKWWKKLFCFTC